MFFRPKLKIHLCLLCEHLKNLSGPVSLTTEGLYFTFTCLHAQHSECDLFRNKKQPLIYDIVNNECWVDGSSKIPNEGCINFKRSIFVTKEALNKFKKNDGE